MPCETLSAVWEPLILSSLLLCTGEPIEFVNVTQPDSHTAPSAATTPAVAQVAMPSQPADTSAQPANNNAEEEDDEPPPPAAFRKYPCTANGILDWYNLEQTLPKTIILAASMYKICILLWHQHCDVGFHLII